MPTYEQISPSVIAIGEPGVEKIKVASIGSAKAERRTARALTVIRGGVSGDALPAAGASAPAAAKTALPKQKTMARAGSAPDGAPESSAKPRAPMPPPPDAPAPGVGRTE